MVQTSNDLSKQRIDLRNQLIIRSSAPTGELLCLLTARRKDVEYLRQDEEM